MEDALPPRLAEIVDDFALAEGREKLELLLQYAGELPPLPAHLQGHKDRMEPIPECMSPVFSYAEAQGDKLSFVLDVPEEAPTVRGYAAILSQGLNGLSADEILAVPLTFYEKMGLIGLLSGQRLNGMRSILARLKMYASKAKAGQPLNNA